MSAIDDDAAAQREAELHAAFEAFEAYAQAKRKADASLTFADCHDAAQAWVRLVNLYLPREMQIPPDNVDFVEAIGGVASP